MAYPTARCAVKGFTPSSPPSPQAEKATAQDQAGKSGTCDGTGNAGNRCSEEAVLDAAAVRVPADYLSRIVDAVNGSAEGRRDVGTAVAADAAQPLRFRRLNIPENSNENNYTARAG
jgi:hypothetical protein